MRRLRDFLLLVVLPFAAALGAPLRGRPAPISEIVGVVDGIAIHTVRVNAVVKLPPDMLFLGKTEGVAMMAAGPLLGQQAADATSKGTRAQLASEMQANHIDVGDIVAAEFARQASAGTPIKFVVSSAPADAQVDLVVNAYGLAHSNAFGSTLYPVVNLSATMKAADGAVIWQATHVAGAQDVENKDGHALEEFLQSPELLRQSFIEGSDIVARVMVQDLVSVPKSRPGHLDATAPGLSNAFANR